MIDIAVAARQLLGTRVELLTLRQIVLIGVLADIPGPHTVRGLATRLRVDKPVISRAVTRLSEMGLATRRIDPDDRRSVLIVATDDGHDVRAALRNAPHFRGDASRRRLAPAERETHR